jgi:hypothetical protein
MTFSFFQPLSVAGRIGRNNAVDLPESGRKILRQPSAGLHLPAVPELTPEPATFGFAPPVEPVGR